MRVTSHAEDITEAPGGACACGEHHAHVQVQLVQIVAGLALVFNSFFLQLLIDGGGNIASASSLLGALVLAAPLVWTALKDLRSGALNTNSLVALAILALFASGYYQEAGIVSFFMLLGQIIETRTAEGALASIHSLIKLTPTKARRVAAGGEHEAAVHELGVGDLIRVRPGDNVAADGIILSGQVSFNQANITGESLPVDKKPGDEVFAGTINLTGVLDIRVTHAGQDTTLGRVRNLILAAEKTKLPIVRIIDQYMGFYTPLVLVIGGLVWVFTQDLSRVVSVFIVSCPCAFVLASPTAMVAALSAAARLGILIKNVAHLELAAKINAFVFDKTGTLTSGKLAVSRLAPLGKTTPAELLRVAASAEQFSNHPTAKALAQLAEDAGLPLLKPTEFSEAAGRGVKAHLNGDSVVIGRAQWLRENGVADSFSASVDLQEAEGWSLIFVACNRQCLGWVGLADQTRSEARESLAALKDAGARRIAMVSGDRQPLADRVGREIGCEEVVGDCLPQHKVDFVHQTRAKGYRVAVVGDGVNDAPALAAGDLGIAMGAAGSEVAIHSATIALMNNDLRRVPFLVRLSRETRRVINQNFLLGLAFVVGGMALGVTKFISPIIAALFHVSGSLLVVFNSFRLMLGLSLLGLLPHAMGEVHSVHRAMGWLLSGFLVMFFLQRFLPFHHHDVAKGSPVEPCGHTHSLAERSAHTLSWVGVAVGLSLHSVFDGLALAAAVASGAHGHGEALGLGTALAVILHKPFGALAIITLMAASGTTHSSRHLVNLAFALVTPLGALLFYLGAGPWAQTHPAWLGGAMAFCAGTFLCIACADLLPELQFHKHDRIKLSLALLAGLSAAALMTRFGHEGYEPGRPPEGIQAPVSQGLLLGVRNTAPSTGTASVNTFCATTQCPPRSANECRCASDSGWCDSDGID
ncbi:MAG: heavy metal translocating P-type ATPase [Chloroflexi bacterium]|nr:heavy metal translocating P-type ATPase [Chloroflexota bacterium]